MRDRRAAAWKLLTPVERDALIVLTAMSKVCGRPGVCGAGGKGAPIESGRQLRMPRRHDADRPLQALPALRRAAILPRISPSRARSLGRACRATVGTVRGPACHHPLAPFQGTEPPPPPPRRRAGLAADGVARDRLWLGGGLPAPGQAAGSGPAGAGADQPHPRLGPHAAGVCGWVGRTCVVCVFVCWRGRECVWVGGGWGGGDLRGRRMRGWLGPRRGGEGATRLLRFVQGRGVKEWRVGAHEGRVCVLAARQGSVAARGGGYGA
jgi:hypothetical protein